MTNSAFVWDQPDVPFDAIGDVLLWQSYASNDVFFSIPRYLEDHADRLRTKYLAFIHDLGESQVKGKRIVDHLDMGDGSSFWWMTLLAEKNPIKSPGIYNCLRLLALEEILLEKKPASLTLVSSDLNLVQAVRRLCQNLQIEIIWQHGMKPKQKLSLLSFYHSLPHPLQGLISLVRHLFTRWQLRGLQKPQWFSGGNAIFLCSYFMHMDFSSCSKGHFNSMLWGELPNFLYRNGKQTNWIQHFLFNPEVPDARTGLGWLRLFNRDANRQGHHAFLDTYLTWDIIGWVLKNWLKIYISSWRLRNIYSAFSPKGSAVWLWPILQNDWRSSLSGQNAISNFLWAALFDAALKNIPHQKIGLYLCENQGWETALLHAWRKHGHGEIIGIAHTTVPFWLLPYFADPRSLKTEQSPILPLPDRLAVNGMVAWRTFVEAGYPAQRLVKVEALRYLKILRVAQDTGSGLVKRDFFTSTRTELQKIRVLILGEVIPESVHSFLVLIENTIKLLPLNYQFTFKPHPDYPVNLANYPVLQADEVTGALDQILGKYDLALAANCTSASVDAYLAGLPVIVRLSGSELNLSPLRGKSNVRFVSTPVELAEALQLAGSSTPTGADIDDLFFLDTELPKWAHLLSNYAATL